MKKSTLAIILGLVGLVICVGLVLGASIVSLTLGRSSRISLPGVSLTTATKPAPALSSSPLIGKWLCNDCGGRTGVSILREYHADGTWTGHVTDIDGNVFDYHGTFRILDDKQYNEVDLTNAQPSAPGGAVYLYSITGNTLTLSLKEGDTLMAEFERAN